MTLRIAEVTGEFFAVDEPYLQIGRGFVDAEFEFRRPAVAMATAGFLKRHFSSPEVIGATVHLDGRPMTILGVTHPAFSRADGVDLLLPCQISTSGSAQDLRRRERAFLAAVAARDPDATAGTFTEGGMLHVAGMPPVEGREAIRRFYGRMFGSLVASTAWLETFDISEGGDMAFTTGRTSNEFRSAQASARYAGKYVLVWRRVAGEWRIAFYGVSSDEPEAVGR